MQYKLDEKTKQQLQQIWQQVETKLAVTSDRIKTNMPYIAVKHRYADIGHQQLTWWTNGFWAGILWQMYHATQESKYLKYARQIEADLDQALAQFDDLDHDVGFVWLNAAVADYRMTANPAAKQRGLQAATILAGRYNPAGGFLVAWNGPEQQGQVIVDCFMNLSLLYWASEVTKDPRFAAIATQHAQTATAALLRPDGSSNHIAVFDPKSGELQTTLGGQGYGQGSAWARGQAWVIYGLTLAFCHNHQPQYLDQAKQAANFFIANVALNDYVSVIDFRAPATPVYYDTTATAITICGLLELVKWLPEAEGRFYLQAALKMFMALTTKFCDFDIDHDELLTKGSAKYHRATDREVPIIYGDAFYVEALLRLLDLDLSIY